MLTAALLLSTGALAQKPIGTVSTADASVGGVLETSGATATIVNNGTVTAHEHTATVTLARGGSVQVCATSVVHLSQSITTAGGPLLIALDHGALELALLAGANDAILTPDMRVQPSAPGPLDLRLRVVSNGDTCIENRGSSAPALMISDTFGESSYIVHPQQHVLFEHGSLKQVVDSETSPCGCPPPVAVPVVSVAESGVSGANAARPGSVVDAHPFPAAVSQGLAPAPPQPTQPVRQMHTEPGITLAYNGTAEPAAQSPAAGTGVGVTAGTAAPASAPAAVATTAVPAEAPSTPAAAPAIAQAPPPPPPPTSDLVHAFVRFYRWVFHRKG